MDFLFQLQFVAVLIAFASLYYLWIERIMSKKSETKEPPKPSGSLPIIGHLHLLRKRKPLAQVFGEMADKHGPVFMIHLGMRRTLVVNSCEAAKECLATNDKVFATRPGSAAGKHMGYNYAMIGFAPYGSYWRSVRKIIMVELLSNARLEALKHVRSSEIDTCMRELHELWLRSNRRPVKVEMKQWLGGLTYNIIVRVVAGKRYFGSGAGSDEGWRFRRAINRIFSLLDAFVASDMFPFLRWMDWRGHESSMKLAAREADSVMTGLLEEHRRRRPSGGGATGAAQDFMDVMLSIVEDAGFSELDVDTVIKATSLVLIITPFNCFCFFFLFWAATCSLIATRYPTGEAHRQYLRIPAPTVNRIGIPGPPGDFTSMPSW